MRSPAVVLPLSTHYYAASQEVTIEPDGLDLNAPGDGQPRLVNVINPNAYQTHPLCRQTVDGAETLLSPETWASRLLEASGGGGVISEHFSEDDRNLAAALVQFVQRQPLEELGNIAKGVSERSVVNAPNSLLEHPMRLYNTSNTQEDVGLRGTGLVDVAPIQTLPSLPLLKRSPNALWYHQKSYKSIDDVEKEECDIEVNNSMVNNKQQQIRKSLPHKKRISKKLKRNASQNSHILNDEECDDKDQQNINMMDNRDIHSEADPHNLSGTNMVDASVHARAMFICQLCGDFYGEDQLKFFYHLKNHYEPQNNMILESIQHDDHSIVIDKIEESMVGSNEPLPDSLVDLSLDDAVSKESLLYQSQGKIIDYTTEKSLFNGSLKSSMYDDKATLDDEAQKYNYGDKGWFSCNQCPKTFKRQKLCDNHIKDSHSKAEEMSEFSEPEDLMEGINVVVEGENEEFLQDDLSSQHSNTIIIHTGMDTQDQYILPHLTIDSGQVVRQNNLNQKNWYVKEDMPESMKNNSNEIDDVKDNEEDNMLSENPEGVKRELKTDDFVVCSICGGVLPNIKDYDLHVMQRHMDLKQETMQCMIDAKEEVSDMEPEEEIGREHVNEVELIETEDEDEPEEKPKPSEKKDNKTLLKCLECDREFKHKNSIVYHMLSHQGKKEFQCEICKKSFYTASAIKVHARLHSGAKPYKCEECGRMFRQWGDLKYHYVSIHSDIKQHQCEYCGKNFARKYSLIIHRRIHTGEKNYRCEFCDKTFRASSYLQTHRKIHTGEKPYPCESCGKKFRMKGDMRRHLRTHNKTTDKEKNCDVDMKKSNAQTPEKRSTKSKVQSAMVVQKQHSNQDMKIEMESQVEIINDDSSGDVKHNSGDEANGQAPNASNEQEAKLVSTGFSNEPIYMWPVHFLV